MSGSSSGNRKISQPFNKIIEECASAIQIDESNKNSGHAEYKTEKEYLDTLNQSLTGFTLSDEQKQSIEVIIYNSKNNDGMAAAAIAYHYLTEHKKTPQILRAGSGVAELNKIMSKFTGKVVLMVDLNYATVDIYQSIADKCKSLIIIDDHKSVGYTSPTYFTSNDGHSVCASTWAIFYPDTPPPHLLQMIDVSDSKKHAAYLANTHLVTLAIGFRIMNNPYFTREHMSGAGILNDMWELITGKKEKLMTLVGAYMHEAIENAKEQIARNAVIRDFQGYKVGVLNFSDPVLTKRVGRQIVTNMNKSGNNIDFAVLWAYEYNKDAYRIQLIDDHRQTKVHLGELAKKLGKIGGTPSGGGGHIHVGNLYWPHNPPKMDIWDLFKKNYLGKS